jgi:predicted nucleic acid-binding protein
VKTRVLDSWPILEWGVGRHPAVDIVDSLLADAERGEVRLLMSAINVGEVYYFLRKNHSAAATEYWRASAPTLPLTIEVPTLEEIWNAALLKGQYPIAYADAFAAALAQKYNCPVITGDPEFLCVDELEVEWIGKRK